MAREAQGAGLLESGEEKALGDLIKGHQYLTGKAEERARLFPVVLSDRTSNGHKQKYRKITGNRRKHLLFFYG